MTSRSPVVDSELKQICQETLEGIKGIAGSDAFSREYAAVQQVIGMRRQQRKIDQHTQVYTARFLISDVGLEFRGNVNRADLLTIVLRSIYSLAEAIEFS